MKHAVWRATKSGTSIGRSISTALATGTGESGQQRAGPARHAAPLNGVRDLTDRPCRRGVLGGGTSGPPPGWLSLNRGLICQGSADEAVGQGPLVDRLVAPGGDFSDDGQGLVFFDRCDSDANLAASEQQGEAVGVGLGVGHRIAEVYRPRGSFGAVLGGIPAPSGGWRHGRRGIRSPRGTGTGMLVTSRGDGAIDPRVRERSRGGGVRDAGG